MIVFLVQQKNNLVAFLKMWKVGDVCEMLAEVGLL